MSGACSKHARLKMRTRDWSVNVKRREDSEDLGVNVKMILEWILAKQGGKV
jgi:hypothetical protein